MAMITAKYQTPGRFVILTAVIISFNGQMFKRNLAYLVYWQVLHPNKEIVYNINSVTISMHVERINLIKISRCTYNAHVAGTHL